MDFLSIIALCNSLHHSTKPSQFECEQAKQTYAAELRALKLSKQDRVAIGRITIAEASNQGDSGLAAVIYTILNRKIDGRFGNTISGIINAKNQFEPATKVGGWQNLRKLTIEEKTKVNTIINLALAGNLPDMTNGALFFQNPKIVSTREKKGTVSKGLTHFNNSNSTATIKDHTFYNSINLNIIKTPAKQENLYKSWDAFSSDGINNKNVDAFSQENLIE